MLDPTEVRTLNLVDGELVEALSGRRLDVIEPATGDVLASVPASDAQDVDAALGAATRAFASYRRTTPGERAEMLLALASAIEGNAEQLESRNVGKPLLVARDEVPLVVDNLRFFAGAVRTLEGRAGGEYLRGYESYVRREPIGVVAGIAPWNYPLLMAAWKFGPALAAGNCSVLKPSRQTPLTALYVASLAKDIFPAGVFNVLSGSAADMGDSLVSDPRIGLVSVTGDTATGRHIAKVDQAFAWANDVDFGLASSIWTQDLNHAARAVRELDFGCVWVNDHLPVLSEMPHGGFKQSGYGKDMSIYALEEYTRIKHVMTKTA